MTCKTERTLGQKKVSAAKKAKTAGGVGARMGNGSERCHLLGCVISKT